MLTGTASRLEAFTGAGKRAEPGSLRSQERSYPELTLTHRRPGPGGQVWQAEMRAGQIVQALPGLYPDHPIPVSVYFTQQGTFTSEDRDPHSF